MTTRPLTDLIQAFNAQPDTHEKLRKVDLMLPVQLLRLIWEFGAAESCQTEHEALIAALKDWIRLRSLQAIEEENRSFSSKQITKIEKELRSMYVSQKAYTEFLLNDVIENLKKLP